MKRERVQRAKPPKRKRGYDEAVPQAPRKRSRLAEELLDEAKHIQEELEAMLEEE